MKSTPPPLTFEQLSERARILVEQCLDHHESPKYIAGIISRTTQEKISVPEIEKFAKKYAATVQAARNARERATYLTCEMIRRGAEISDLLRAAFHEAFARAEETGALREMNPLLLEAAERHREELNLKQKQFSLAERRVGVFEKRLRLDRRKAQAALDKLDRKARRGESLTAKEVQRIREIYGIYEAADQDARAEQRECRQLEAAASGTGS